MMEEAMVEWVKGSHPGLDCLNWKSFRGITEMFVMKLVRGHLCND